MRNAQWEEAVDAVVDEASTQFAETEKVNDDATTSDINVHYGDLAAGPNTALDPFANGKVGGTA